MAHAVVAGKSKSKIERMTELLNMCWVSSAIYHAVAKYRSRCRIKAVMRIWSTMSFPSSLIVKVGIGRAPPRGTNGSKDRQTAISTTFRDDVIREH